MLLKDSPRWIRFGIIFMIISLGLELIDYIGATILCPKDIVGLGCMFPLRLLEIPVSFGLTSSASSIMRITITTTFYFVIGALIGVIVNKTKSKK